MKILICNAGSTSLKFKLWEMPEYAVLAEGRVERVGSENAIFSYAAPAGRIYRENISVPDYTAGIQLFLDALTGVELGVLSGLEEIAAVGYKTVLRLDWSQTLLGYAPVFLLEMFLLLQVMQMLLKD